MRWGANDIEVAPLYGFVPHWRERIDQRGSLSQFEFTDKGVNGLLHQRGALFWDIHDQGVVGKIPAAREYDNSRWAGGHSSRVFSNDEVA